MDIRPYTAVRVVQSFTWRHVWFYALAITHHTRALIADRLDQFLTLGGALVWELLSSCVLWHATGQASEPS